MAKLKKSQFYCVSCRKIVLADEDTMYVKVYKNRKTHLPVPTLKNVCPKCSTNLTRFIKHADESKLADKYGRRKH